MPVPQLPPLVAGEVSAGFPSPADDHLEAPLDLHDLLVRHPAATFFVRVAGPSMTGLGILPGDILVVDRSLAPQDGAVVVAEVSGEFLVKQWRRSGGRTWLASAHPDYLPIVLSDADGEEAWRIWGVVAGLVREQVGRVRRGP